VRKHHSKPAVATIRGYLVCFSSRLRLCVPELARSTTLPLLIMCSALTAQEDESLINSELQRTLSDPDSEITVTIDAPRDFVFEFLTLRVHDYVADASSVRFDHSGSENAGALGKGTERSIIMNNGDTLLQRFLLFQPPQTYAYFVDMERSSLSAPLDYSLSRYELSDVGDGTTTLRVAVVYKESMRLLRFFVRRGFNSALERDFARAVQIIEAEYRAGPDVDSTRNQ